MGVILLSTAYVCHLSCERTHSYFGGTLCLTVNSFSTVITYWNKTKGFVDVMSCFFFEYSREGRGSSIAACFPFFRIMVVNGYLMICLI
jgi:hypothetical protein